MISEVLAGIINPTLNINSEERLDWEGVRGRDPTLGDFNFFESHLMDLKSHNGRRPNSLQIELGRGFMYSLIDIIKCSYALLYFFNVFFCFLWNFILYVCVCVCVLCILKMIYPSHLEMKASCVISMFLQANFPGKTCNILSFMWFLGLIYEVFAGFLKFDMGRIIQTH